MTSRLPPTELGPLRTFKLLTVLKDKMWEDFNVMCMKNLNMCIINYIQHEADFLFSMNVSQTFKHEFGVETLGKSVAQLHAGFGGMKMVAF